MEVSHENVEGIEAFVSSELTSNRRVPAINTAGVSGWRRTGKRCSFLLKIASKTKTVFPAVLCVGRQELEGMEYSWGSGKYFEPK